MVKKSLTIDQAVLLILKRNNKTADEITVHDTVDFIDVFYEEMTGRSGSEFNLDSPSSEVYDFLYKFEIDYNDFVKEWQRTIGI